MAGNPPPAGSVTPGVVNKKLTVLTNSRMASRLPSTDNFGANGLIASRIAALTSTTPSRSENTFSDMKL